MPPEVRCGPRVMIFTHIDVQNPRRRRSVQRSCGKGMLPEQGFLLAQFERGSKREGMEHQYKRVTSAHLVQVMVRTPCSKLYSGSSPLAVFIFPTNHPSNHHSYTLRIRAVQGKILLPSPSRWPISPSRPMVLPSKSNESLSAQVPSFQAKIPSLVWSSTGVRSPSCQQR
jgi:hypothetical protein